MSLLDPQVATMLCF